MLASGKPYPTKTFFTLSRWSPCRIMALFFEVPPHAQYVFSFVARSGRSTLFPSMPSTIVAGLPHLRISMRTLTVFCSMLMVPQTHRSLGRPQVEQKSALLEGRGSLVIVHRDSILRLRILACPAPVGFTP